MTVKNIRVKIATIAVVITMNFNNFIKNNTYFFKINFLISINMFFIHFYVELINLIIKIKYYHNILLQFLIKKI